MSSLGTEPYGTTGPFGGPGLISILGVTPVAANEIVVAFDVEPKADDPYAFDTATNVKNWVLSPVDPQIQSTVPGNPPYLPKGSSEVPTRTPLIARAEQDSATVSQIHLFTDSRLETRVLYDLEIQPPIRGKDCEVQSGPTAFQFDALRPGPSRRARFIQEDRYRDWDNSFFPTATNQLAATWKLEDSGDIALHEADASLRKRILRRIVSSPGEFAHLPGYGVGVRVKALAKTGDVQNMANNVAAQVRQEPDVVQASCTAKVDVNVQGGSVILLQVFAERREAKDASFLFEFPLV